MPISTLFFSLCILFLVLTLIVFIVRLLLHVWPRRGYHWSARHAPERAMSYSESMLLNFKECNDEGRAPLSMVMLLTLDLPLLPPAAVQAALRALHARHAVLRAKILPARRRIVLLPPDQAPSLPFFHATLSSPAPSDAALIERELNEPLEPALLRCRLLHPNDGGHQKLLLTIDHILLDGPSLGFLAKELLELSRAYCTSPSPQNPHPVLPALPLPVSSDLWLPSLPMPLLMVYAFAEFLWRSRLLLPSIRFLPLTNTSPPFSLSSSPSSPPSPPSPSSPSLLSSSPPASPSSWSTLVELRALSPPVSQRLLRGCKQHATTMGALLACVSCAVVAKLAVAAEGDPERGQVWLHMTVDMRRLADRVQPLLRDEPVGHHAVFLIDTWMAVADLLRVSRQPAAFWQYAHRQRDDFASNFSLRHRHIANHVIAGWTGPKQREILTTYTRTKRQPKGGTVSLSNLGVICPPEPDPLHSSSSSLLSQSGSRDYLFPSAQALLDLGILDVRGSVTQSMPSRHVCVTSLTIEGSLKLSFSFPDYSVSRQGAITYANEFVSLLESLV